MISGLASIDVGSGSRAHDVLEEVTMILRMSSSDTGLNSVKVEVHLSEMVTDIGGDMDPERSSRIFATLDSKY